MRNTASPREEAARPPLISDAALSTSLDVFHRIVQVGASHWRSVAVVMTLVLVSGLTVLQAQPRRYSASVKLLIHPQAPRILDDVKDLQQDIPRYSPVLIDKYYHTQADILTGGAVAGLVVDSLGLATDESFVGSLVDKATGKPVPPNRLRDRAVRILRDSTDLTPLPESQIFVVTVTDESPNRAALLTDSVVDSFVQYSADLRAELLGNASTWLEAQVVEQRTLVEASEQALQTFREEHGLESMSVVEWRDSLAGKVGELTSMVSVAERERTRRQAEVSGLDAWLSAGQPAVGHPLVAVDPTVRDLSEAILGLERGITRDVGRYGPKMQAHQADVGELALVREHLAAEVARVIEGVRSGLAQAEQEEALLRHQFVVQRDQAVQLGSLELEYNRLQRIAGTHTRLYESILRRHLETELSQHVDASTTNILEYAKVPMQPSHPRMLLASLAILLGTLLAGVLTAALFDTMDGTLRAPEDLESFFHISPIGVIPELTTAQERELFSSSSPRSAAAECMRSIRTNLLFLGTKGPIKRLLVTSADPREGKTTICANFGATMALAGHRVLLIDSDMRRPRLHRMFDLKPDKGLSSLLVGDASLDEAIYSTEVEGLDLLPCGPSPHNPAELLGTPAFDRLLERLGESYDYLLLDSPPTLAVTDAKILAQATDGTILVTRIGRTERRQVRSTLKMLAEVNANLLGVVCNGLQASRRGYGYGYGYGYYRHYGEYGDVVESAGEVGLRPVGGSRRS